MIFKPFPPLPDLLEPPPSCLPWCPLKFGTAASVILIMTPPPCFRSPPSFHQ
uniref:Uncharacterized protein n=1 Tax=Arundo donax TaxID=35708 RepID=A0A0A9BAR1_ARUDO